MKSIKILLLPFMLWLSTGNATSAQGDVQSASVNDETLSLREWHAGDVVSMSAIEQFGGIDKCFAIERIPDEIWKNMQGKSYRPNRYIGREDLRYLRILHYDYDKKIHLGEMVCNRKIADKLIRIFKDLYDAQYPIQQVLLPDVYNADDETQMRANNTSCFCYRTISNSRGKLSAHARGLAVDLNTLYNPYCRVRKDGTWFVQPSTARQYCDRTKSFKYKIDENDLAYRLFTKNGFVWGGHWRASKDYQHFELKE